MRLNNLTFKSNWANQLYFSDFWMLNFRMLTEFVLIFFIKLDVRKTLNINISGYVNYIIIEL